MKQSEILWLTAGLTLGMVVGVPSRAGDQLEQVRRDVHSPNPPSEPRKSSRDRNAYDDP